MRFAKKKKRPTGLETDVKEKRHRNLQRHRALVSPARDMPKKKRDTVCKNLLPRPKGSMTILDTRKQRRDRVFENTARKLQITVTVACAKSSCARSSNHTQRYSVNDSKLCKVVTAPKETCWVPTALNPWRTCRASCEHRLDSIVTNGLTAGGARR